METPLQRAISRSSKPQLSKGQKRSLKKKTAIQTATNSKLAQEKMILSQLNQIEIRQNICRYLCLQHQIRFWSVNIKWWSDYRTLVHSLKQEYTEYSYVVHCRVKSSSCYGKGSIANPLSGKYFSLNKDYIRQITEDCDIIFGRLKT
jgi:hypothetical protein